MELKSRTEGFVGHDELWKQIYLLFSCLLWKWDKKEDEIRKSKFLGPEYSGIILALGGWNKNIEGIRAAWTMGPCLKKTKTKQNETKAEYSRSLLLGVNKCIAIGGGASWPLASQFTSPSGCTWQWPCLRTGSGLVGKGWPGDQESREWTRVWFSLSSSLLTEASSFSLIPGHGGGGQKPKTWLNSCRQYLG